MTKIPENLRRCVVSAETARMLRLGHPWVVADRHTARWPKGRGGDLLALVDEGGAPLGTALYDPGARVVARLLDRELRFPDRHWYRRILRAAAALRAVLDLGDSDAWRMINAEGDGLPAVTVDRYGDWLLVQYYTRSWEPHLPVLIDELVSEYAPRGVYAKFRPAQTRGAQDLLGGRLAAGAPAPPVHTVSEDGLRYRVELAGDLHTGLFLDQRDNRRAFRRLCAGQRVLNLFAYTGAFSVAAAAGGAVQVTSVDASARYLERARENFSLNGLDSSSHECLAGDCFVELARLARGRRRYEVIFLDPPSFSTTRDSRFTTSGGTGELVRLALDLLPTGGLLVCSSNHQKIDWADYLKELRRGALAAGRDLRVIATAGQGGDFPYPVTFPEGRYLKYVTAVAD